MPRYDIIIVRSDEDKAFVADVPDLAGRMAHGDTHESALAAVKEADALVSPQASDLDALFESLKTLPPSGRTIEEIDRQVAEERDSWER